MLVAYIMNTPTLETPHCIGKNLQQALRLLSEYDLNAKLLDEKEDNDIPAGTIIAQQPTHKQKIKPQQTVFLVVSKPSKKTAAPSLLGKTAAESTKELRSNGIIHKNYPVPSAYPHDTCIAQLPTAGEPLVDKKVITYSAATITQPVVFPNLMNISAQTSIVFLQKNGITPHISHVRQPEKNHVCNECVVVDQKPLAGSLIYLDAPLDVHLHINHI